MRTMKMVSVVAVALLAVVLVGCGSAITATLDLIVTTAQEAIDIAAPQDATLLAPYFTSVTTFVDQATAELASTDSAAQKAAVIAADAAKIVAPNLSSVGSSVAQKIAGIAPLVADIVAEVQALTAAVEPDATPAVAQAFLDKHHVKAPSSGDIEKIKAKNAKLKAAVAAKTKK